MSHNEKLARAYCRSIGADPDELVLGVNNPQPADRRPGPFVRRPRWQWYLGVSPEGLKRRIG